MDSYSQCIHTHVTPGKVCILVVTHTHTYCRTTTTADIYIYAGNYIYNVCRQLVLTDLVYMDLCIIEM